MLACEREKTMLQIISLLVENKPGALMRVTGLLSQLGVLRDRYQAQKEALQTKAEASRKLRQDIDVIEIITE